MTDIKLGQSIKGSLTAEDIQLNGFSYDEYNISNLDAFRYVKITLDRSTTTGNATIQIVNADTGAVLNSMSADSGILSIGGTSFPGINYKIQVIGEKLGNYKLSVADGGRASSIVSSLVAQTTGQAKIRLGTISSSDVFTPLGTSIDNLSVDLLTDIALSPSGKLYGIGHHSDGSDTLYAIDPNVAADSRIQAVNTITSAQGVKLTNTFNALEFSAYGKLYGIGSGSNKLYEIDPQTSVATSVADLPTGFSSSGDIVYDTANHKFLAISKDTNSTDALWEIPLADPGKTAKIGQIGFIGVQGLGFEKGQLTGFTTEGTGSEAVANRIKINADSGVGVLAGVISSNGLLGGISGAASIPDALPTVVTPDIPYSVGSQSQGLPGNNTIDLSGYAGQSFKADITTTGDAAYVNNIGFYAVEDALLGTIKLTDGSLLNPGDANYMLEAAKSAVLQAGKIDSQLNQDIVSGKIYAPIMIAQGSFTDFVTKNPTNGGGGNAIHAYVNYASGNADKVNHFKFLGNNNFGVEDMHGGGDKDFNDLVVSVNIKTV
jgi:Domain of unknown function (DUF4114)